MTSRPRAHGGATWGLVGGWGGGCHSPCHEDSGTAARDAAASGVNRNASIVGSEVGGGPHAPHGGGEEIRMLGGDDRKIINQRRYCGKGNFKNASATAPWATTAQAAGGKVSRVQAVGVAKGAGTRGGGGASGRRRGGRGGVYSFEDQGAFRDAMDELGLLVGLGQQEVLTLVSELMVR